MIQDQNLVRQVLDTIDILMEAASEIFDLYVDGNEEVFKQVAQDIVHTLDSINGVMPILKKEAPYLNTDLACESLIYSIKRIITFSQFHDIRVLNKLEFEFLPLLQEMKLQFYFWACVYGDTEKMEMYYKEELPRMTLNPYIDQAEQTGQYKYDLSIAVLAYNKLEYTKMCIESLMKYIPENLNFELILINHGSTDGTLEYFETLPKTKQLDILKNGGGFASLHRIVEGKYLLFISNDVLVTENAISNMIKCMESDDSIGYVVPTTPNVSNLQSINGDFSNTKEMYEFCRINNVSDSYRWEQRNRLCDPISLSRTKYRCTLDGVKDFATFISPNINVFPDDRISLLMRRKGLKLMLAKDAYCYHFGSVTLKDEVEKENQNTKKDFYTEGRYLFSKLFGVDPWGVGFCYDYNLFKELECSETAPVNVLGINCGLGANSLKIKELLKEKVHNIDVTLCNVTDDITYIEDLKGISDFAQWMQDINELPEMIIQRKWSYIIFEDKFDTYVDIEQLIDKLKSILAERGVLIVKTVMKQKMLMEKYGFTKIVKLIQGEGQWVLFYK